MRHARCAVLLAAVCGVLAYGEELKKAQSGASEGVVGVRTSKNSTRTPAEAAATPTASAGSGELVATNFTIQSGGCVFADSTIDYVNSGTVSITLLSNNSQNMSQTRIIPLFAVGDGTSYVSNGGIIDAGNFYYINGGGGSVTVQGRFLRIRVCNDAAVDVSYAQLTARGSGTAN